MTDQKTINEERSDSSTLEATELTRLVAFVLDIKRKWEQMRFTSKAIHADLVAAGSGNKESIVLLSEIVNHCELQIARAERWLPSREARLAALVTEIVGD